MKIIISLSYCSKLLAEASDISYITTTSLTDSQSLLRCTGYLLAVFIFRILKVRHMFFFQGPFCQRLKLYSHDGQGFRQSSRRIQSNDDAPQVTQAEDYQPIPFVPYSRLSTLKAMDKGPRYTILLAITRILHHPNETKYCTAIFRAVTPTYVTRAMPKLTSMSVHFSIRWYLATQTRIGLLPTEILLQTLLSSP